MATGTGPTGKRNSSDDRSVQMRIALIGAAGAIIAAAVGAIIGLNPWSHSSPSPSSSAPSGSSVPSRQCVFLAPVEVTCTSSDPNIVVEFNNEYNTIGCTFSAQVNWGDGSPLQTFNFPGALPGPLVLGDHKYSQEGTYTINGVATVTFGLCAASSATGVFTLG